MAETGGNNTYTQLKAALLRVDAAPSLWEQHMTPFIARKEAGQLWEHRPVIHQDHLSVYSVLRGGSKRFGFSRLCFVELLALVSICPELGITLVAT